MATVWDRAPGVVWEKFEDEVVMVDASVHKVMRLNATAAFIWKHCDGRTPLETIVEWLSAAAGDARRARDEVRVFCEELEKLGLLRPGTHAAPAGGSAALPPPLYMLPTIILLVGGIRRGPGPFGPGGGGSIPP